MDYRPKIKLSQDEFRVLASNTRIDILKLLDESQYTVSDISRKLDMNKATVHEHLAKLREVGLVKKDDTPRKWVYYQLTWKGRNLLHPERVRVMVSLGIMLTVIVIGALIIASQTDLITPDPVDEPPLPSAETSVHIFWDDSSQANVYDIRLKSNTALGISSVMELNSFIETDPTSITRRDPIDLRWAREGDVIHLYDHDNLLDDHQDDYLYVEGKLLDDRAIERPFSLRRYIVPKGLVIDLRISALGIVIDTTNLSENGCVTITFEVENVGTTNVTSTMVEVFSIKPTFKASGFPLYGSPYLRMLDNRTVSIAVNGSVTISFEKPASELFMRGVMVVVDPYNEMPEVPTENNLATLSVPDEVRELNERTDDRDVPREEGASAIFGIVVVMVGIIIIVALVVVFGFVLRRD